MNYNDESVVTWNNITTTFLVLKSILNINDELNNIKFATKKEIENYIKIQKENT